MQPMAASPNTYDWSCTTGATGSGTMSGDYQELDNNVFIKFGSTTGHTIGDQWILSFMPVIAFNFVGNLMNNALGTGLAVQDVTNGVSSVVLLGGNITNGVYVGLINVESADNNQANLNLKSDDGFLFEAEITVVYGETSSRITTHYNGVEIDVNGSSYYLPRSSSDGFMYNNGGNTTWVNSGWSGTYSIDDGFGGVRVITVDNGLITNVA